MFIASSSRFDSLLLLVDFSALEVPLPLRGFGRPESAVPICERLGIGFSLVPRSVGHSGLFLPVFGSWLGSVALVPDCSQAGSASPPRSFSHPDFTLLLADTFWADALLFLKAVARFALFFLASGISWIDAFPSALDFACFGSFLFLKSFS